MGKNATSKATMPLSHHRLPVLIVLISSLTRLSEAFVTGDVSRRHSTAGVNNIIPSPLQPVTTWQQFPRELSTLSRSTSPSTTSSSTSLGVWWFGGTETTESQDSDSCELVAVRIEKPSSSSRRILGEIVAPVPLKDVWAILTDYDRLAVHVPNLVESRISKRPATGEQGDGSYSCRLFQRGAQQIVGFEFGASVTMDMKEEMTNYASMMPTDRKASAIRQDASGSVYPNNARRIRFKCVDSFFFNNFDGEWAAQERIGEAGKVETLISYVVEVRPKGPVPVAALEWRIREDVPTNLRAVKAAAMAVGYDGVMASRGQPQVFQPVEPAVLVSLPLPTKGAVKKAKTRLGRFASTVRSSVQWDTDETMAAYLTKE